MTNTTYIHWKQRFDNYRRAPRQLTAAVDWYRSRPLSVLDQHLGKVCKTFLPDCRDGTIAT